MPEIRYLRGIAALALVFSALSWSGEPPRPRNVILILVDTLRADHLGAWGYARPASPNLDAFARESVAVAEQVQVEDVGVCEEVQRNLNSRSYTTGRFSVKRENGGYYFHQLLGRALQQHTA